MWRIRSPSTAARGWLPLGQCEVCRAWCREGLCAPCRATYAAATPRCRRCGIALPADLASCGDCLRDPPPFQATVCAVTYAFPWDGLIAALKFADRVELATPLAMLLADRIADPVRSAAPEPQDGEPTPLRAGPTTPPPSAIVPVPLSPARLAQRGYNQAWELARRLSSLTGVPAHAGWLQRAFDAPQQVGLSRRQRRDNLRGCMRVTAEGARRIGGRHVAVVDDVMTTGATACEAARALLEAGAQRVDLWVVARTPAH